MIHDRAIIDSAAQIDSGVEIGPYSIIGSDVKIAAGCVIGPHVVIKGPTQIGIENQIFQFSSIGDDPQDKKYNGETTRLEIGDRNVIREFCSINRGTVQDAQVTRIGNDNWIMAYVHIAHDCQVGNNTIFANSASLAGHVTVEDNAILAGFALVHQFCKIGSRSFIGLNSIVTKDVPPYLMVTGQSAKPRGLNVEGLKRSGATPETLSQLKKAYKIVYRSGMTLENAIDKLKEITSECTEVKQFADFLTRSSQGRGIVR